MYAAKRDEGLNSTVSHKIAIHGFRRGKKRIREWSISRASRLTKYTYTSMYVYILTLGTGPAVYQHLSIDTREIAMPVKHTCTHVKIVRDLITIRMH